MADTSAPSALFRELLKKRGLKNDTQIEAFLKPDYQNLHDPMLLPDIKKAVNRLKKAYRKGEKLMIFGDYDADGVTASAVLYLGLKQIGFPEIEVSLPHRVRDGYGIPKQAVAKMKKAKASLAISVDCGSRDYDVIKDLTKAGFDVIVTDHHETSQTLPPDALAVVNPKRTDSKYPFRHLAGVVVAFKLVQALQMEMEPKTMPPGQEKWLLDLVAIGTVCDCMELVDENRILAHFGFQVISKTRRKGLRELLKVARGSGVSSQTVGFIVGPRINAAGRLDDPTGAYDLLVSEKASEAVSAALRLEKLNERRKRLQDKALKQAKQQITSEGELSAVICVAVPGLHEGIIGIVAGKLVEEFKRPAWVFTETPDGSWKGSGRSFGDFDLAELILETKGIYERGGGHQEAAGVTVKNIKKLHEFKAKANDLYASKKLDHVSQAKHLLPLADMTIKKLHDLSYQFVKEISQLEPFGKGNPEPLFELSGVLLTGHRVVKDKYLALTVRDSEGTEMELMAFRPQTSWFDLANGDKLSLVVTLEPDEWRGRQKVRGLVQDLR